MDHFSVNRVFRLPFPGPTRFRRCAVVALASVAVCLSSCEKRRPSQGAGPKGPSGSAQPTRDHFPLAFEFLKLRDEHNLNRSAMQVVYHLNQWIQQQSSDPRWMIDRRLFSTLPLSIRVTPAMEMLTSDQALAQLKFVPGDVVFLEQSRWLHATAAFVREQPADPELTKWLQQANLPENVADELAICERLFDWTIRNIQLDELLPYPKNPEVGPVANPNEDAVKANWPPPMRGEPGPGYRYFPWHVLLYGHGDTLQRARIFTLLARQLHIDVVMLGIETKSGRPQAWLPAAILGNQLYLFDTGLGLPIAGPPIAGPNGRGIATLSQVVKDPGLLTALNVGRTYTYPVGKQDLAKIVAMIDASPEYLAQRMRIVESHLAAADQMVLSVSLAEIKKKLGEYSEIKDVFLWAVPFEAAMFQRAFGERMAKDQGLFMANFFENGPFMGLSPLVLARRQHLLGNFDNADDQSGAKTLYLGSRIPDTRIEAMNDVRTAEAMMGIKRDPNMSDAQWAQILNQERVLRIRGKQNASYFVGLAHMENGDDAIAVNWFKKRTLEATPDGPWSNGARYNLARCYESLGQIEQAKQLYMIDESPQRHGNLLRVRRLEQSDKSTEE